MKRLIALLTLGMLALTACGTSLTVIDSETLKAYPEVKGVAQSWQGMVDAAQANDCETFLSYMRLSLQLDEEACPAALAYMTDAPEIDWARTEWNATGGKARIYVVNGGGLTGFILNEATDVWGADEVFWEN